MSEGNRPFDSDECERFYKQHEIWLRGVIRTVVGRRRLGDEDILQSFLLRLMEKPVPGAEINDRGYCYKMLKNFTIDINRKTLTYERYVRESVRRRPRPVSYGPFREKADKEELCDIMEKAVEYLPSRVAIAVKLYLIKGYATGKIAEKMGVEKKTVIKYVSDGKKMLRVILNRAFSLLIILWLWFPLS